MPATKHKPKENCYVILNTYSRTRHYFKLKASTYSENLTTPTWVDNHRYAQRFPNIRAALAVIEEWFGMTPDCITVVNIYDIQKA